MLLSLVIFFAITLPVYFIPFVILFREDEGTAGPDFATPRSLEEGLMVDFGLKVESRI